MATPKKPVPAKKTASTKKPVIKVPTTKEPKEKKLLVVLPKSMGACADLYAELRDERLSDKKLVDALELKEKYVKNYLTTSLSKGKDRGAVGQHHRVQVEVESVPQAENWDKFYAYIVKTKDFSLLNRAINTTRVQELWDDGKVVPGIASVPVLKLRLHKI